MSKTLVMGKSNHRQSSMPPFQFCVEEYHEVVCTDTDCNANYSEHTFENHLDHTPNLSSVSNDECGEGRMFVLSQDLLVPPPHLRITELRNDLTSQIRQESADYCSFPSTNRRRNSSVSDLFGVRKYTSMNDMNTPEIGKEPTGYYSFSNLFPHRTSSASDLCDVFCI